MNALPIAGAALAAALDAATTMAAPEMQPPMNDFDEAYYLCDNGAFLISYDASPPTSATMTTSSNNKRFELKRETATKGVQFSGGPVKFWTDGKTVIVDGAQTTFRNCKIRR